LTLQTVKIGNEEVKIEDDLPFGEIDAVMDTAVDLTDPDNPQLSMVKFRTYIVNAAVKEAPFKTDIASLNALPYSKMSALVREVTKYHPLSKYLVDWLTTYLGSQELSEDVTKSMLSVPNSSDGTSNK
jgi:hypothetical protein